MAAMSLPWQWEETAPEFNLAVDDLTDDELSNLAKYRATLAANTRAGHPDHDRTTRRLREVYEEIARREVKSAWDRVTWAQDKTSPGFG